MLFVDIKHWLVAHLEQRKQLFRSLLQFPTLAYHSEMARFEPVRTETFPYSQDVGVRPSTHEGPEDNDIVYTERTHPTYYHAMSPPNEAPLELEAGYDQPVGLDGYGPLPLPPRTAASEESRVTLFYHGYGSDENRHWVDEEVMSSGDETVHEDRNGGYTDRTPMITEAAPPATSDDSPEPAPEKDPNLVTWSGPDDPLHPHNWPGSRRWASTALIAMFAFIAPMASTMLAPALHVIRDDLDVETDVEEFLLFSIFLLAFAM